MPPALIQRAKLRMSKLAEAADLAQHSENLGGTHVGTRAVAASRMVVALQAHEIWSRELILAASTCLSSRIYTQPEGCLHTAHNFR
eukprot:6175719-Pleurochrysis_carterae.AAC.5